MDSNIPYERQYSFHWTSIMRGNISLYKKVIENTMCDHSFISLFPCQSRLQEEMGYLSALFCLCEVGVVTVQL